MASDAKQTGKYSSCCRTCLNDNLFHSHNIFSSPLYNLVIAELLTSCTSIQVKPDDDLPKNICGECYKCLCNFYEFKNTALLIEKKLQNKFSSENPDGSYNSLPLEENDDSDSNSSFDCTEPDIDVRSLNGKIEIELTTNEIPGIHACEQANDMIEETKLNSTIEHTVPDTDYSNFEENQQITDMINDEHDIEKANCGDAEVQTIKKKYYFRCSFCRMSFKSNDSLNAHCNNVHFKNLIPPSLQENTTREVKLKGFSCDLCTKQFVTKGELSTHRLKHTIKKPFACVRCSSKFASSDSLNRHLRSKHLGIKPFKCGYCPKTFASAYHTRRHEVVHTGERRYVCTFCGCAYTQSNDLRKHEATAHLTTGTHKCDTCLVGFKTPVQLARHKCGTTSVEAATPAAADT